MVNEIRELTTEEILFLSGAAAIDPPAGTQTVTTNYPEILNEPP
ncbi:MAG TPA: hypothetical protein VGD52_03770 [Pseudoduganella sp.]